MIYREFGKTGEKISAIGFGCMRLPEYESADGKKHVDLEKSDLMIKTAFEKGINYFDTAPYYCNKNSEAAVGHGVKAFRDKILLSSKFPGEIKKEDFRKQLELIFLEFLTCILITMFMVLRIMQNGCLRNMLKKKENLAMPVKIVECVKKNVLSILRFGMN